MLFNEFMNNYYQGIFLSRTHWPALSSRIRPYYNTLAHRLDADRPCLLLDCPPHTLQLDGDRRCLLVDSPPPPSNASTRG